MFEPLLSLKLKTHILETNSHCTPELLIYALGDLTINNLTYTAGLLGCQHPTFFGQYENFFYLFIDFASWVQGLLVLDYGPSPYVTP